MALPTMSEGFLWGAATAAFQIEGATREGGRGESIWDRFCATPGRVTDGATGDPACDHYHRYRDDVGLMQTLGLDAYRFSIAWPRIIPDGTGAVCEAGLDFYDRLVEALLEAGIRPFATLYHWDLPQALQDRWGGWTGRDTAEAFAQYADVVTRRLGDRVKDWITLNEPWCSAMGGYGEGWHAPGLKSVPLALVAGHNLLLAHGQAVPVIRANSPEARVGISLNLAAIYTVADREADPGAWLHDLCAQQACDTRTNRWFLDPIFLGTYPDDFVERYGDGLVVVRDGDMEIIRRPLDFLGVNCYAGHNVQADPDAPLRWRDVIPKGAEVTATGWQVQPENLYDILVSLHEDYAPAAVYITENGAAFDDVRGDDGQVHDGRRRAFLEGYIGAAKKAVDEGVPLKGYFVWSLLDNFEWSEGYTKRFGIVYVDYPTQERVVKDSGRWYADGIGAQRAKA